jgi:cytochrome c556
MDLLADMVKGKTRYDRKLAQDAADNLLALARLNNGRLWPQGSGLNTPALKDLTRARPGIWKNRADVSALHAELAQALEVLVKNAGWSIDSLEESFADVAAACKACHDDYRARPQR